MKKIFFTILVFCLNLFSLTLTEEKLELEKSIKQKVSEIIEKSIGSKNYVVVVNIELKQVEQIQQNTQQQQRLYLGQDLSEIEYLPGITYPYMPPKTQTQVIPLQLAISRVIINIIVDKKVNKKLIDQLKLDIPNLAGLNLSRGDIVEITTREFEKTSVLETVLENILPKLWWPILIVVISIFLFGHLSNFFKTVVSAIQLRIDADARLGAARKTDAKGDQTTPGLLGIGEPLVLPGGAGFGGSSQVELSLSGTKKETQKKHFDFINKSNIKSLWYLIKDEPIETIALIMNYLSSDLVMEFMSMLDRKTQARVTLELASVKMPDPQEVNEIEQNIKTRIDYCIGGEEYFLSLLDQADKDVQDDIIQNLSFQNPQLAEKLKEKLFLFEDLLFLDKMALQKVIRESQRRGVSLAIALKGAQEEVKNKVMDCLTEGGRAMLAEQIDLLGEIGDKLIKNEKRKVVSIVRELANTGEISLERSKFIKEETEKKMSVVVQPEEVDKKI